jgi:hypothetical protein
MPVKSQEVQHCDEVDTTARDPRITRAPWTRSAGKSSEILGLATADVMEAKVRAKELFG